MTDNKKELFETMPVPGALLRMAIPTIASQIITPIYYCCMFRRVRKNSVLDLPRGIAHIRRGSLANIFSIGVPAACSLFLYDLTNIVINRLSSSHGDLELAAMGIVLKVERLPLNVGIGICMGMIPLIGYNYASGNHRRMDDFFTAARIASLGVAALSLIEYRSFAAEIIGIFISDAETVRLGTAFLRARCFAPPFMFLCFNT